MMSRCQKQLLFLFFSFVLIVSASGQNSFYKFKISEEGVYKLTLKQAQEIGFSSLSEIAIFGYPGMLPQLLKPENLELQEIPSLEKDGNLYFYLSSSSRYEIIENEVQFQPNHYSDSISYLIGWSQNPKKIQTISGQTGNSYPTTLYEWHWLKEDINNILNSGRIWYSRAVAPGSTRGYAFPLETKSSEAWKITGKVMGRSSTASSISLEVDDLTIAKQTFDGIPSSTYAIKGQEFRIDEEFIPTGGRIERFKVSYESSNPNDAGHFEYLGIGVPHASELLKVGAYSIAGESSISLSTLSDLSVWEISDLFNPKSFNLNSGTLITGQKFLVFNDATLQEIQQIESANLDLRIQSSWPDLLIIAPKLFSSAAEKLSTHKIGMGIYSEVAYLEDIYDAFGYGNHDLNAIRNFIAWNYNYGGKLKNVLILGKGTFDYKSILGGRPNLVPIYTSRNSLNPLTTFSSDDYYSLLKFGQGQWEENREGDELMQIGIGRLPVINTQEARIVVDKIIAYESNPTPGEWKKTIAFFADDGDNNIHIRDSESLASILSETQKEFKQVKLYLDKYPQESNGESQSSIEAKNALEETLDSGTLLLNYIGHGNETTLTAEEVFLTSDISNWAKQEKLALWVTATCEFGRHDSPFLRSAAEELLIAEDKGAIGLLSTGRPVFSSVNFSLNEAFIEEVFKLQDGISQDLGSIFRNTKNKSLNGALNRNFSLLADPSMKLSSPDFLINLSSLHGSNSEQLIDTLSALQEITFEAEIINPSTGGVATKFNGNYVIELYDKASQSITLGDESNAIEFMEEKSLLFRGEGEIISGLIIGKLVIPKNLNLAYGEGKLRIVGVSQNQTWEAFGVHNPIIGGTLKNTSEDTQGPVIKAVFGGKDASPFTFASNTIIMNASFSDSSGINISSYLPSENLTVQINQNTPIQLNEHFIAENNNFTSGKVKFTLTGLIEGKNLVTLRAWDNLGNETVFTQEIIIQGSDRLQILNYKTYPNPTQIESNFQFEHNKPGENLILTLAIYQTDGKILFSESERLVKADAQIGDLSWSFLRNQTKYPVKGTYIYKLTLVSEFDNSTDSVSGLIVIQ